MLASIESGEGSGAEVDTEAAAEVVEGTDDPETEVRICQVLSHGLAKRLDRTPPRDVRTSWIYNMAGPSW